ncbi:MAG: response regulator transcription factor [Terrabacter sp.]|nr:response regulator transcription factor [Terrabacter sp.]
MDGQARVPVAEEPITVFLLDDHELVRRGVRTLLESEPGIEVIGESGSATEGEAGITTLRPHVAIVDGRLPDGSGIEVCRQVRSVDPHIAVLVLTSYDDDDALFAAILAGASGYVLKQISGGDLVMAVRRVAAGQSMLDPTVTTRVLHRLRQGSDKDALTKHLTPKEEQVLSLVAEGLTNRQIAERLGVAEKTVKNYVSTLLAKLGVESRTQAAVMAARRPMTDDGRPGRSAP